MYSVMPEDLPAFVTVCPKQDNTIAQSCAEMAAQNRGGGTGFTSSP